ncbi:hypothetical protein Gotur_020683, partial [Gossypium turneri]
IDLLSQAYNLLHDEVYKLWTDGRRILAFPNENIQEERNEESVKLLKKIADMEIEEFSSHIIEKNQKYMGDLEFTTKTFIRFFTFGRD